MTKYINKVQTGMINKTTVFIKETNSVIYATKMAASHFGFFLKTLKVTLFSIESCETDNEFFVSF